MLKKIAFVLAGLIAWCGACPQLVKAAPPPASSALPAQAGTRTESQPLVLRAPLSESDQRSEVRRLTLQRAKIDYTWPVSLLVAGGGMALLSMPLYEMTNLCRIGDTEDPCAGREEKQRNIMVFGLVSLGVAVIGLVWLFNRIRERDRIDRRLRELLPQHASAYGWELGFAPQSPELLLRARF